MKRVCTDMGTLSIANKVCKLSALHNMHRPFTSTPSTVLCHLPINFQATAYPSKYPYTARSHHVYMPLTDHLLPDFLTAFLQELCHLPVNSQILLAQIQKIHHLSILRLSEVFR